MNELGEPMDGVKNKKEAAVLAEVPEYAGFWIRAAASVIDTILLLLLTWPLLAMIYGPDAWQAEAVPTGIGYNLINYVLPALAVIAFWIYKSATPGKMIFGLVIVDAKTGGIPSKGQLIGRYFAYYASIIPLFLGFIWVGFDKRKQGFHDKLASTVVVRRARSVKVEPRPKARPALGMQDTNKKRHIQSVERMR